MKHSGFSVRGWHYSSGDWCNRERCQQFLAGRGRRWHIITSESFLTNSLSVDGAIHRAAGPRLRDENRDHGGCGDGEAVISSGYKLPAKCEWWGFKSAFYLAQIPNYKALTLHELILKWEWCWEEFTTHLSHFRYNLHRGSPGRAARHAEGGLHQLSPQDEGSRA